MIKKILIANIVWMLTIGFNVLPAEAYTELKTPVSITATGILVGTTLAFSVNAVDQEWGSYYGWIDFLTPSGVSDSGEALEITGGTNEVGARIIIYTDNDLNTTYPNAQVPTVNPNTGIDGGGLVGQSDPGYTVPLFWGVRSVADSDPNILIDYVFDGNLNDGIGEVYIVDRRHTHSFVPVGDTTGLDGKAMYKADGTPVVNTQGDGLYPQYWDIDLYDAPTTPRNVVSPALYKTIATVAYGIGTGSGTDSLYYVCQVPRLSTVATDDSVKAKLAKIDGTAGGSFLYIYIGGDFSGKPAQTYSTAQLKVAIVKD